MHVKTVATLGPASTDYETMKAMVLNGVRIFRLNFSHSDAAYFEPLIKEIRKLESDVGVAVTVMGDLCGPKTRIGEVDGSPLHVAKNARVCLGLPDMRGHNGDLTFIDLDFPELLKGLDVGMPVSLSDGMLQFKVTRVIKNDRLFELTADNAGLLTSHKGIAFPGKSHPLPAMTDKDRTDLHQGLEIGLDAVALSFVQSMQDIEDLKAEIARHGAWVPVVAKIERQNAFDNLDSILDMTDVVMVARGDLGLECPLWQVPIIQKRIIRACRHHQKACIVATQMLLSMVKNPLPTRAETTDVANAIMDGADCVMLSEETAIGSYPVETTAMIRHIADSAEAYYLERLEGPFVPKREKNPAKTMAYCACLLAENMNSRGIVSHTTSGDTARLLASRRPKQPIFAVTPDERVERYLNFFWGVHPRPVDTSTDNHLDRAQNFVIASDGFKPGDSAVITAGPTRNVGPKLSTNKIKVWYK